MNEKQIIRAALVRRGITQPELSRMMNLADRTVGSMLCRPNDLTLGNFFKILDALGYDVVVKPRKNGDNVEFMLADNNDPIETELYAPEVAEIRANMKPPK